MERSVRSTKVKTRVAYSHEPFVVKTGMSSWKAKRVPVGRRLAKFAADVRVCDMAW